MKTDNIKSIAVVAAVIVTSEGILATQRGSGGFKDKWEFPGGKIEAGETPEQALMREIREELDLEIRIDSFLDTARSTFVTPWPILSLMTYLTNSRDSSMPTPG